MMKRQIQVKLVKVPKSMDVDDVERESIDYDKVNEMVADQVFNTAVVIVAGVTAVKLVDTLCKIAINVTNPANWR